MYLCSKCFDILYSKYHKCTKCDFKNIEYEEENIEIDSKLAFQISILNKKGYKTKFCCSGHALDEWVSSYIYFEDKIDSCPEDWYIDDDGYIIRGNRNRDWIELDFITRENILTNYNGNLLKWVLELEPKENIKVYYVSELMDIYFKIISKIIDIFDTNQAEFIENVAKENSILIESANITFEGFCSECKKLLSK